MSIELNNLDYENKKKLETGIIVSESDLIGNIVKESVRCKSFPSLAVSLPYIVRDVKLLVKEQFEDVGGIKMKTFSYLEDLHKWLKTHLMNMDSINQLNVTEYEFEKGVSYSDTTRLKCNIPTKDDFVDIDAFIRNVAHDCFMDYLDINFTSFKLMDVQATVK